MAIIRMMFIQRISINICLAMNPLPASRIIITDIESEREILIAHKSHFREGEDAEYLDTEIEKPLQHTAKAKAARGMHIWNKPTPVEPVY